jgi:signal transduction histidine kinase
VMHSGVRNFEVTLRGLDRGVELEVCDRGSGFDPRVGFAFQTAGLVGMTERLNLVGGNLSIESEPGAGTTVRARVALEGVEDHE